MVYCFPHLVAVAVVPMIDLFQPPSTQRRNCARWNTVMLAGSWDDGFGIMTVHSSFRWEQQTRNYFEKCLIDRKKSARSSRYSAFSELLEVSTTLAYSA